MPLGGTRRRRKKVIPFPNRSFNRIPNLEHEMRWFEVEKKSSDWPSPLFIHGTLRGPKHVARVFFILKSSFPKGDATYRIVQVAMLHRPWTSRNVFIGAGNIISLMGRFSHLFAESWIEEEKEMITVRIYTPSNNPRPDIQTVYSIIRQPLLVPAIRDFPNVICLLGFPCISNCTFQIYSF